MLKIGKIKYLNVYPFYAGLNDSCNDKIFIEGEPSYLNRLLYNGEIDISPSSSFEYFVNSEKYFIVKNLSISSLSEVLSVNLLLTNKIEDLDNVEIYLSPASATSNMLVKVIFKEFFKNRDINFKMLRQNQLVEKNHLLIGDAALEVYFSKPEGFYIYDVAKMWFEFTKLPFVFALWMINKHRAEKVREEINAFIDLLLRKKCSLVLPSKYKQFGSAEIKKYFEVIDYNLTDKHIDSLNLFGKLLYKHRIISSLPRFYWWENNS
jgi:chorismate dehydratase